MSKTWSSPALRRRKLAAIHVAKTQLQMAEESYRALLQRVSAEHGTACDSAANLTPNQAAAVLTEMARLGAKLERVQTRKGKTRPGSYPGKPDNYAKLPATIAKVEAQLADMGLSWGYADAIAKRMWGVAKVAWLQGGVCKQSGRKISQAEQLAAIVAALDKEQALRDGLAYVQLWCRYHNETVEQLAERLKLPAKWPRRVETMKRLCERLETWSEDALARREADLRAAQGRGVLNKRPKGWRDSE
jgi:phage gp16-like protein